MWKKGQKLVCLADQWVDDTGQNTTGPKKGEIVTYDGEMQYLGNTGIFLLEYPVFDQYGCRDCFHKNEFRPVDERKDADTIELIRKFSVPEVSDLPMVPQPENV